MDLSSCGMLAVERFWPDSRFLQNQYLKYWQARKLELTVGIWPCSDELKLIIITGDSKVSIFDLDSLKTTLILKPSLVLDIQPTKTIFAHNKPVIEAKIPKDNDSILITLAKDNSLVCWDINSGLVQKKFLFESEATCFDCVKLFLAFLTVLRTR